MAICDRIGPTVSVVHGTTFLEVPRLGISLDEGEAGEGHGTSPCQALERAQVPDQDCPTKAELAKQ